MPYLTFAQNYLSDYNLNARSIALGGSAVAISFDPTASFWNPASIAFLTTDKILLNIDNMSHFNFMGFTKFFPPKIALGINIVRTIEPDFGGTISSLTAAYRFNSAIAFGGNLNFRKKPTGEFNSSFGLGIFFKSYPEYNSSIKYNSSVWRWFRSEKMKDRLTLGIVFHNIPLEESINSQVLRIGSAFKPFNFGPLFHLAYHLDPHNYSFRLGCQINVINKVDLLLGIKDFNSNKFAAGICAQWNNFYYDVSYEFDTETVNFSLSLAFNEDADIRSNFYRNQGAQHVKNNQFFSALHEYQKALTYDPDAEDLNLLVAVLQEKVDERDKKIDSLFALGQKFEEKGWYINAFHSYKSILDIDQENKKTRKQLKSLASKLNKYIEELFIQAQTYFKKNDINQSDLVVKKILSVDKNHPGAQFYAAKIDSIKSYTFSEYYYRGIGYYKQNNYKRSLEELNKALALNPSDKEAFRYKNLAIQAIDQNEQEIKTLMREAEYFESRDQFVKANNRYRRILEIDNNNQYARDKLAYLKRYISKVVESKFLKAKILFDRDDYSGAIGAFAEILSIDPNHSASRNYLNRAQQNLASVLDQHFKQAELYFNQKEYEKALEECNNILSIDNNHTAALTLQTKVYANISLKNLRDRGMEYYQKNDYVNAQKTFSQIITKDPTDQKIREYLRKCEGKIKERIEILFNQGMVSYSEGDYRAAIQVWNRILKMEPNHSNTLEYIKKATDRLEALNNIKQD